MDKQSLIIYALTRQGAELGSRLALQTSASLWLPQDLASEFQARGFSSLLPAVGANFSLYARQVFICATGIAVRAVAPHLRDKTRDPAVAVLDQEGRHCISLVSGHLGGANDLVLEVAAILDAQPVISTATDCADLQAVDLLAREKNLHIANSKALAAVNMALLQNREIQIFDPQQHWDLAPEQQKGYQLRKVQSEQAWHSQQPGIWIQEKARIPHLRHDLHLHLIPRCLVLGLGCNRGTSTSEILELVLDSLLRNNFSLSAVCALASIAAKADELGLLQAASILDVPLQFVAPEYLSRMKISNPSPAVYAHMGVYSVCEAAALFVARSNKLLLTKTKSKNATLAIALQAASF